MEYALDDGMYMEVQDVLSKLKFIAKWTDAGGKKLNVGAQEMVDNTLMTKFWRTVSGHESRHLTLKFARNVVEKAIHLATKYLDEPNPFRIEIGTKLVSDLRECRPGIKSCCSTYVEDQKFVSDVEAFLSVFDIQMSLIARKIADRNLPVPPTLPV